MYPNMMSQLSMRRIETAIDVAFDGIDEVFAGFEAVVELNVQTVKTSLSEQRALTDAALAAGSIAEVIDLQTRQLSAAVTKTFAYWRHVEDTAVQTGNNVFSAMHEHSGSPLRTIAGIFNIAISRFVPCSD